MPHAVIIGAGHNGLVAGCFLARAGWRITVCEQADKPGGCVITEEVIPGFRFNTGALELEGMVSSGIAAGLELEKYGLHWLGSSHLLASFVGDDVCYFSRSLPLTLTEITRKYGSSPAENWSKFTGYASALLDELGGMQHVKANYAAAFKEVVEHPFKRLGRDQLADVLTSAEKLVCAHLDHEALRSAAIAYSTHPEMPPWLPGSGPLGCLLASSHGTQSYRPAGGSGSLIDALIRCLRSMGSEVRCNSKVVRVQVDSAQVEGVELWDGQILNADAVLCSVDVKRLITWLDPAELPELLNRAARRAHTGSFNVGEFKLDVALSGSPNLAGLAQDQIGSLYYLQHSSDHYSRALKQILGGVLPDPIPMMAAVPSVQDPTLAPPGCAVLWLAAFVPIEWSDGRSWPAANDLAAERMLSSFESFAPGFRRQIIAWTATGPAEWEARTGNYGGNPNHLDMTVDQLFTLRPGAGLDSYHTPIRGLYLTGAGTHPGGGVHGVPGELAARAVLTDQLEH